MRQTLVFGLALTETADLSQKVSPQKSTVRATKPSKSL